WPPHSYPLSLHDALPISAAIAQTDHANGVGINGLHARQVIEGALQIAQHPLIRGYSLQQNSAMQHTRRRPPVQIRRDDHIALIRSEEHTSELQSRENLVC